MRLRIDCISKKLGLFSLRNVSLEVGEGEYFVLLGPTGAGKTVLLEVITGFHRPDKGNIILNGRDITDMPIEKREIGYVPQNCPLFPHMNVFENVEFGLKMRRTAAVKRKKTVDTMLEIIGLDALAKRKPLTLSSGERQKVVLARALVTEPKIVLLDEPLTAIDAETHRSLKDELKRINRELHVTMVHVTHDQIEGFSVGDKIAIMQNGEIVQLGRPTEVLTNPKTEFVARFLGYENVFRVRKLKHEMNVSEVSVQGVKIRLVGGFESWEATVAVRPEDIILSTEATSVSSEWNAFEGEIRGYTNLGPVVEVTVDAGLILKVLLDKRSFLQSNLALGKRVHVRFRLDSVKIVSVH